MAYEADLEKWCREHTVKRGGYLLKWVSPGNKGVPDRLLFMPFGQIAFIEFKAPKGKVSSLQEVWQARLTLLGFDAYVVSDKEHFLRILRGMAT